MKIIYGSSSQKSIDRHQRITNRERRKKRETSRTSAESPVKSSDGAAVKTDTKKTASREDALQNNRKSIPHEISLIQTEFPAVPADSQMIEKNRKGVLENEPDFQSAESAFQTPQTSAQTSAAVGMPSESSGTSTASVTPAATHETTAANADSFQQCDDRYGVSGLHGRSRRVREMISSSQMDETALPMDASSDSSFSSSSLEGQVLLGKLNQLLENEVNLYEILLPAGACQQNPVIIFLHEETQPEC